MLNLFNFETLNGEMLMMISMVDSGAAFAGDPPSEKSQAWTEKSIKSRDDTMRLLEQADETLHFFNHVAAPADAAHVDHNKGYIGLSRLM